MQLKMKKRVTTPAEAHDKVEALRAKVGSIADLLGFIPQKVIESDKFDKAIDAFTRVCDMELPVHIAGVQMRLIAATMIRAGEYDTLPGTLSLASPKQGGISKRDALELNLAVFEDAFALIFAGKDWWVAWRNVGREG